MSALDGVGTVANYRPGGSALFLLSDECNSLLERPISFGVPYEIGYSRISGSARPRMRWSLIMSSL